MKIPQEHLELITSSYRRRNYFVYYSLATFLTAANYWNLILTGLYIINTP